MAKSVSYAFQELETAPDWLVEGFTNLLPKNSWNIDPYELQTSSMPANNLQHPHIHPNR